MTRNALRSRPAFAAAALAIAATYSASAYAQTAPAPRGSQAGAPAPRQEVRYARGVILVAPKAGMPAAELDKVVGAHGGKREQHWRELNVHVVRIPANADPVAVAAAMARNPSIKYAQADVMRKADMIPNDPSFGSGWHLGTLGAPTAWDRTQGEGVTMAVCDSGVDPNHPDLVRVPGYNMFDNNTNSTDVYGHGTKVAGAVAMTGGNGLGGSGVAMKTKIMPIRVTDTNGWGYDSAIANCITWAADNGARGANVSFGGVCSSPIVQAAAKYMRDRGGVVTASAGNSGGLDGSAPNDTMTCVGATDSSDTRAGWSTYGDFVDVTAPGDNIFTTINGGGYGGVSGTSFSAPVTLGVYALMMAANPALTPGQLDTILFTTAKDLGTTGKDQYYGYGRIDAAAAVAKAGGASIIDSTAPTVAIGNPTATQKVTGTIGVDVAATDAVGVTRVELYVNGKLLATDTMSPFGFSWDTTTATDGTSNLVAKAYDAAGNVGTSKQIAVTVANDTTPPVAKIVSPGPGSAVNGTVTITAGATDNQKVSKISLQIDGREVAVTYGSSLSYAWNTSSTAKVRSGSRKVASSTITVIAEDPAGNKGMASETVVRQ